MEIQAIWSQPIQMKKDPKKVSIFILDADSLPETPGVYVFGRKHGKKIIPIYIGETLSIRGRVKNHLKSVPLMKEIENSPKSSKFLIYCTVKSGSLEKSKKHIKIIERAIILHAQAEGHELFNKKGTKLPTDVISFNGNRTSEAIAPRKMLIKKALV